MRAYSHGRGRVMGCWGGFCGGLGGGGYSCGAMLVHGKGGMQVKAEGGVSFPRAALMAVQNVFERLKGLSFSASHTKLRATRVTTTTIPGPRAQYAMRAFARLAIKIGRIEDVKLVWMDSTRRKGERCGLRL